MKKKLTGIIVILFCFSELSLGGPERDGNSNGSPLSGPVFVLYPSTPRALKSDTYRVMINGQEAFVEKLARFDIPVHFVRLAYNGKQSLSVEVLVPGRIHSYRISPVKNKVKAKKLGNRLLFSLYKPGYVVVKVDSLEYLFLLIDEPEVNPPVLSDPGVKNILDYGVDRAGGRLETNTLQQAIDDASANPSRHLLYFPAGEYRTGELRMKSNVFIYLEPGAVIKGSSKHSDYKESLIRFENVKHVRIMGRGTIDGSGWDGLRRDGAKEIYLLFLSGCQDIWIDGPVLRDPCFWNTRVFRSSAVHLRNLKIINNCPALNWTNTDGVDFDSSTGCDMINAIMHTGDDNMVVKGLDTTGLYNTEQIRFEKVIGISNSAAAKIGTETSVKQIQHIAFRDIDVVRCKRAFVISGFDSSEIRDILVSGMRVEQVVYQGKEKPRIIDIEVTDKSWRDCTGRCRVSDIMIRNMQVYFPLKGVEMQILGRTPEFGIRGVAIKGLKVQNRLINSCSAGHIRINDFVSGLTF